jgi:RIP homotypic interaction motif
LLSAAQTLLALLQDTNTYNVTIRDSQGIQIGNRNVQVNSAGNHSPDARPLTRREDSPRSSRGDLTPEVWKCGLRAAANAAHAMMIGMAFHGGRLGVNVARAALAVAVVAGGFTVWYRATYHAFPGQQVPSVRWCGRDYQKEGPSQARRQVTAQEGSPIRAVGHYPPLAWWGQELFALSPRKVHSPGQPCAIVVYLHTGQDSFQAYALEGGP